MNIRHMIRTAALFLLSTLVIMSLWINGLEVAYAHVIVFSTNSVLNIAGSDAEITIEKEDGVNIFRVRRIIEGNLANYPQKFETLLLPFVSILAWQVFSAFYRKRRQSIKSAGINILMFIALQTCFLLLLTIYYTSVVARYVYDTMLDSFYITAIAIIIIDYIRYPILLKKKVK